LFRLRRERGGRGREGEGGGEGEGEVGGGVGTCLHVCHFSDRYWSKSYPSSFSYKSFFTVEDSEKKNNKLRTFAIYVPNKKTVKKIALM